MKGMALLKSVCREKKVFMNYINMAVLTNHDDSFINPEIFLLYIFLIASIIYEA